LTATVSVPGHQTPANAPAVHAPLSAEFVLAPRRPDLRIDPTPARRAVGAALLGIAIALVAVVACALLGLLLAEAIFRPGGLA
jgi:hypothetical protein